jgi:hypothetical protein
MSKYLQRKRLFQEVKVFQIALRVRPRSSATLYQFTRMTTLQFSLVSVDLCRVAILFRKNDTKEKVCGTLLFCMTSYVSVETSAALKEYSPVQLPLASEHGSNTFFEIVADLYHSETPRVYSQLPWN